jgi:hypothetical protein
MPTKAEAQSTSVTPTAASGSQAGTAAVSEEGGEGHVASLGVAGFDR